jgi:endogenous inhibitor of DNA gyrase (YacG/DUF329 family)
VIDLGDWAAERYRVPLEEDPGTLPEDPEEKP